MTNHFRNCSKFFLIGFVVIYLIFPSFSTVTAAFRYLQEGMQAPDVVGDDLITGEKVSSKNL